MNVDFKTTLLSGGDSKAIKFWNISTGNCDSKIDNAHESSIYHIELTNLNQFATCGGDGVVKLWSLSSTSPRKVLSGHTDAVYKVRHNISRDVVISGGVDKTLRLWSGRSGKSLAKLDGHGASIRDLRLMSKDGNILASCSEDRTLRYWDVNKQQNLASMDCEQGLFSLDVASEKNLLCAGSCTIGTRGHHTEGFVHLWDSRSRKKVAEIKLEVRVYNSSIVSVRVLDSNRLICAHTGNHIDVVDLRSLKPQARWRSNKMGGPGLNPIEVISKTSFVTCPSDCKIKLWGADGTLLREMVEKQRVNSVCFLGHLIGKKTASRSSQGVAVELGMGDEKYQGLISGEPYESDGSGDEDEDEEMTMMVKKKKKKGVKKTPEKMSKLERIKHVIHEVKIRDLQISVGDEDEEQEEEEGVSKKVFKSFFFGATPLFKSISNGRLRIGKYGKKKEVKYPDEKVLMSLFFGYNLIKSEKDYLQLFALFDAAKLFKYTYVVLKNLEKVTEIELLLKLFYYSYRALEDPKKKRVEESDSEEDSDEDVDALFSGVETKFCSVLNTQLFNIFKSKYFAMIRNSSKYIQIFEKLNLLSRLLEYKVDPIETHENFVDLTNKGNLCAFSQIYELQRRHCFITRDQIWNVMLVTSDGKEIRCCKEYLIAETDYFHKKIDEVASERRSIAPVDDDDSEEEEEGEEEDVDVLRLPVDYVGTLIFLRYIHMKELVIDPDKLHSAFVLLAEVSKFRDSKFVSLLMEEMRRVSAELIDAKEFKRHVFHFGYFLHKESPLEDKMKSYFLSFWANYFEAKKLIKMIQNSHMSRVVSMENEQLRKTIESLKSKISSLESGHGDAGRTNSKLKERISKLESEKEDLKKKLKRSKKKEAARVKEIEDLKKQLVDKDKEIMGLKSTHTEMRQSFTEVSQQYNKIPKLFRSMRALGKMKKKAKDAKAKREAKENE